VTPDRHASPPLWLTHCVPLHLQHTAPSDPARCVVVDPPLPPNSAPVTRWHPPISPTLNHGPAHPPVATERRGQVSWPTAYGAAPPHKPSHIRLMVLKSFETETNNRKSSPRFVLKILYMGRFRLELCWPFRSCHETWPPWSWSWFPLSCCGFTVNRLAKLSYCADEVFPAPGRVLPCALSCLNWL
jgi:hypothetical protein